VIISLALVLLVTASGTLATYLYDEGATFAARLCAGACIGITTLGLIGFLFASFLGLSPLTILFTLAIHTLPLIALRDPNRRAFIKQDLISTHRRIRHVLFRPSDIPFGYVAFYLTVAVVLWQVFQRGMIERPDGIYTGVLNNFGDLPFHLSVITSFAYGNNFLPEDPTYAGVRFTYPFLTDFVSAIFVRCGADLRQSMFIENFVLALAFVGLLHRWALVMVRDRLAAMLTPVLVILNGGFGWVLLWEKATADQESVLGFLKSLPPSFTVIPETTWRWGNAISTLLIPQRGFLLGLPLAVIVFTQWWLATSDEETTETGDAAATDADIGRRGDAAKESKLEKSQKKSKKRGAKRGMELHGSASPRLRVSSTHRIIAAGIIAGLLPLVHAHSLVVVMLVGGCIAIAPYWRAWLAIAVTLLPLIVVSIRGYPAFPSFDQNTGSFIIAAIGLPLAWWLLPRKQRILWGSFFLAASVIALPQMWWSTHNSAVNAKRFFEWQFGWDRGTENVFWFWLKNSGLFIPLTVAALLWRGKRPLVSRRLLLFFLPFTLCFIVPNVLKMAPWIWDNIKVLFYWWLASAPLVALLISRLWRQAKWKRIVAIALFACVIAAGALDVAAILISPTEHREFDSEGIRFAELIKQKTEPKALVIHAPVHNHPVFLTGRRSLMGYPGHIWTHGLDFVERESEIRRVYAGNPDAEAILRKYGVQYAVVSPLERNLMSVNDSFFSEYELVGEVGGYRLYKITKP
jgi:hypothetical protein